MTRRESEVFGRGESLLLRNVNGNASDGIEESGSEYTDESEESESEVEADSEEDEEMNFQRLLSSEEIAMPHERGSRLFPTGELHELEHQPTPDKAKPPPEESDPATLRRMSQLSTYGTGFGYTSGGSDHSLVRQSSDRFEEEKRPNASVIEEVKGPNASVIEDDKVSCPGSQAGSAKISGQGSRAGSVRSSEHSPSEKMGSPREEAVTSGLPRSSEDSPREKMISPDEESEAQPPAISKPSVVSDCESEADSLEELEFDVDLDALTSCQAELEAYPVSPPPVPWETDDISKPAVLVSERVQPPAPRRICPKPDLRSLLALSQRVPENDLTSASAGHKVVPHQLSARSPRHGAPVNLPEQPASPEPNTNSAAWQAVLEMFEDKTIAAADSAWLSEDFDMLAGHSEPSEDMESCMAREVSQAVLDWHVWKLSQEHESMLLISHERGELNDKFLRSHTLDSCNELAHLRKGQEAICRAVSWSRSVVRAETEVITAYSREADERRQRVHALAEEIQLSQEVVLHMEEHAALSAQEQGLSAEMDKQDSEIKSLERQLLSLRGPYHLPRNWTPARNSQGFDKACSTEAPTPELLRLRDEARALSLRVQAARCASRGVVPMQTLPSLIA